MGSSVTKVRQYESDYYIWTISIHVLCHPEFIILHEDLLIFLRVQKNRKIKKTQLNRPQWTTFKWSVSDVSTLKWMESDTVHHSALWKQILSLMHHSQTSKRCSVAPQQHSQLWPFNMLPLRFIPLHLLLSQKMLTNLSNHFCNMLHHTSACHAICHVSLLSVNIYLLKLDCSASTHFCRIVHTRPLGWLLD